MANPQRVNTESEPQTLKCVCCLCTYLCEAAYGGGLFDVLTHPKHLRLLVPRLCNIFHENTFPKMYFQVLSYSFISIYYLKTNNLYNTTLSTQIWADEMITSKHVTINYNIRILLLSTPNSVIKFKLIIYSFSYLYFVIIVFLRSIDSSDRSKESGSSEINPSSIRPHLK